jgi:hypothetical protein
MESSMKRICIVFVSLAVVTTSYAQDPNVPWVSLFNGRNLEGWKMVGSTGHAEVIDGMIQCHQVANTPEHTFVCTQDRFSDFILEMDVKTDPDYNTGILLRCIDRDPNSTTSYVSLYGYQIKIDPTPRAWTGGVFDDFGKTWNWLHPLDKDERGRKAYTIGQWNHFRVEAIGTTLKIWVNGIPTTHMVHSKYTKGYIALKIHSLNNQPEKEKQLGRFKNIMIITDHPEKYLQPMDILARVINEN